ncbi:MAG: hypothetical protein AAB413_02315 [Patescibacteria group bacterium]
MTNSPLVADLAFTLAALIATVSPQPVAAPTPELAQGEPLNSHLLLLLQPEPSLEEPRTTGVCYNLRPQETLRMLVKGAPAIPQGGDILISGSLGAGVEAGFASNQTVYTGDGWNLLFQIPATAPQEELILIRNIGESEAPACFRLAYQIPPELEPLPEFKGGNEPPTHWIPPAQPNASEPRSL